MTYTRIAALALLLPVAVFADLSPTAPSTLSSGQTLNLDTGAIATSGGDIQFTGGKIVPMDAATAYLVSNAPNSLGFSFFDEGTLCALAPAYTSTPVASTLDNVIGIHTNAGHYSKLWITAVTGSSVTIQFVTYTSGCPSSSGSTGTGSGGSTGSGSNGSTGEGGTPGGPAFTAAGVVNAASYANPANPNGAIAEGSIFNVFGTGLGPQNIVGATTLPLQQNLAGTSVSVTVNGTTVQCYMLYTLATQIAAILPSNTPVGTGTITVSYNGTPSASVPITVAKSSPGIFALNEQGSGTGIVVDADYKPSSTSFAFQPGEEVVAWGTGLGPISGSDATTPPPGNLPGISVTVVVGGINVTPLYAGRTGYAGEDQINFTIPPGVTGCNVPVAIMVTNSDSTVTSNYVTMAVDPSLTCSSQKAFPPGFQTALDSGSVRIGTVLLNHSVVTTPGTTAGTTLNATGDQGQAGFNKISANAYSFAGFDLPYGACIIANTPPLGKVTSSGLDPGSVININGPGGARQLTESTGVTGAFYNIIGGINSGKPLYFSPGSYAVDNGTGGKDVGSFNVNVTVPQDPFTWTNYSSISTVSRRQALTVNWTGGDPSWDVYLVGSSTASLGAPAVAFQCRAHDTDESLTVPVSILQALPASGMQNGFPLGSLTMNAGPSQISTATVQVYQRVAIHQVQGLDLFTYLYSVEYQNSVITFQ